MRVNETDGSRPNRERRAPSRRAILAVAGSTLVAGCTGAAGNDTSVDPDEYVVTGFAESTIYDNGELDKSGTLSPISSRLLLRLEFDPDGDYNPLEHEVTLFDGEEVVAKGEDASRFTDVYPEVVTFALSADRISDGQRFRLVSRDATGIVDEFDLQIRRRA